MSAENLLEEIEGCLLSQKQLHEVQDVQKKLYSTHQGQQFAQIIERYAESIAALIMPRVEAVIEDPLKAQAAFEDFLRGGTAEVTGVKPNA